MKWEKSQNWATQNQNLFYLISISNDISNLFGSNIPVLLVQRAETFRQIPHPLPPIPQKATTKTKTNENKRTKHVASSTCRGGKKSRTANKLGTVSQVRKRSLQPLNLQDRRNSLRPGKRAWKKIPGGRKREGDGEGEGEGWSSPGTEYEGTKTKDERGREGEEWIAGK